MKINTHIDREKNLRTHCVEGLIDIEQLKASLMELYVSPDYDQDMNALWDLRSADTTAVTTEAVRSLADMVQQHWGTGNSRAALVATDDLNFGLSRMYEMLVGSTVKENVRVFKKYEDAIQWLTR